MQTLWLTSRANVIFVDATRQQSDPRAALEAAARFDEPDHSLRSAMQLYTYLNYGGNCRQAFEFYTEHLGGKIVQLMTHGEMPDPSSVAPERRDDVLHARMEIGGTMLLAADVPPERFQPMRSAYLSLSLDSNAEAERVYSLLAEGGEIFMKMEETFFAHRFAMLRDRFGTSWMLLHERN